MRTVRQVGAPALAFITVFALAQLAQAQEPAPAPAAPAPAPAPAPTPAPEPAPAAAAGGGAQMQMGGGAQAQGGGAMTLPGAAPAAQAAPGDSDHDQVVGSLGIGYLGLRSMAVGCAGTVGCLPVAGAALPGAGTQQIGAPIIGIRYWIDQTVGIDAGLGVGINSASLTNNAPPAGAPNGDVPQAGSYAFLIHGGLPLALASSGHYSFQIIPEVNVGFGGWSLDRAIPPAPAPQPQGLTGSGFHFDVGARAGAEIHFGFIGLPKLALQGSIGLLFAMNNTSIKDKEAAAANPTGIYESKGSQIAFGTTVQDNPWNIFTTNVAALYYF